MIKEHQQHFKEIIPNRIKKGNSKSKDIFQYTVGLLVLQGFGKVNKSRNLF